ncbi:MAG: hypothetical protein K9N07_09885 [Candidatus Cloacimonetes bacterium]|nr:hypothetical protein [Candidatus Cloacimonadota bacterium]
MNIPKVVIYLFLIFTFSQLAGQDTLNDSISLQYSIIGMKGADSDTMFKIEDWAELSTKDSIKINYKYQPDLHFYLIIEDKDGYYLKIVNKPKQNYNEGYTTGWLNFNCKDIYNIYLILSRTKQVEMEKEISNHSMDKSPHIERVTKKADIMLATTISKPDAIGVVFRGAAEPEFTKSLFYESKSKDMIIKKIEIAVK